jgi:toxin-antitoxin system PIN domain toxin
MRALFDVSMLLALFDPGHVMHRAAMTWWQSSRAHGWASCPLSENGFLRIISQRSYPRPVPLPDALATIQAQVARGGHEFWPDDLSILDAERINHTRLLGPAQITDIYLLALAVRHNGRLVTLDRSMDSTSVRNAAPANLVIVGQAP